LRTSFRAALVSVATLLSLLATTTAASAHVEYNKGRLYQSDPLCVDGRSEISHGVGGGYSRVDTWARQRTWVPKSGWIQCGIKKNRPKGYIANRILVFKWLADGSAGLCTLTHWDYNDKKASHFAINFTMGAQPDCGRGWYYTYGQSYVRLNATWHGDDLFSGWHYLPASTSSTGVTPSAMTSIPASAKVVDESGNLTGATYSTTVKPAMTATQPEPEQDELTDDVTEIHNLTSLRP
jgi:hypothetical protein